MQIDDGNRLMPPRLKSRKLEVFMLGTPSDEDALQLMLAFCCIMEPEMRAKVIVLAEQLAKESQRVVGKTHFLDLNRDVGPSIKVLTDDRTSWRRK